MALSAGMVRLSAAKVSVRAPASGRVALKTPMGLGGVARMAKPFSMRSRKVVTCSANIQTYNTPGVKEDDLDAEFLALKEKKMVETMVANTGVAEDASGPPHKVSPTVVEKVAADAIAAAGNPTGLFLKAVLAGVFIGLGGTLCSSVGGDCPALADMNPGAQRGLFGALGFPLAIFLVTTLGASAMTGTIVMVAIACMLDKMTTGTAAKVLTVAWLGNAVGLCSMAALAAAGGMDAVAPCVAISLHKAAASWWQVFFRGIGGAILICSAIMQAYAARNGVEKLLGIWFCIGAYVMCGWEHGLANLFFFPCAIFGGAPEVTWGMFIDKNLIPSTLGNIAGGVILGAAMTYIHLPGKVSLPKISVEMK